MLLKLFLVTYATVKREHFHIPRLNATAFNSQTKKQKHGTCLGGGGNDTTRQTNPTLKIQREVKSKT